MVCTAQLRQEQWQTDPLGYNKAVQPTPTKARVVIYSRPGCHLCDEAKLAIAAAQCPDEYTLAEIDIESDPELLRRHRYDIPVITINGEEAFLPPAQRRSISRATTKAGAKPTFPT